MVTDVWPTTRPVVLLPSFSTTFNKQTFFLCWIKLPGTFTMQVTIFARPISQMFSLWNTVIWNLGERETNRNFYFLGDSPQDILLERYFAPSVGKILTALFAPAIDLLCSITILKAFSQHQRSMHIQSVNNIKEWRNFK